MGLIIVGAGGFAREARIWAEESGQEVTAFLSTVATDPDTVDGLPVLREPPTSTHSFLIAIGNPKARKAMGDLMRAHDHFPCAAIVHPTATLGRDIRIGLGTIICPGVVITTNVDIGMHVIVNLNCTIGHDAVLDDFVTLSPGVHVSGNCQLMDGVYVGTGAVIREKKCIGKSSTLGMGAVLTKDQPANCVWVGNPAKEI